MKKTLLNEMRNWLFAVTGMGKQFILPGKQNAPGAPTPYLNMVMGPITTSPSNIVGEIKDGAPVKYLRTHHSATVTVTGFGVGVLEVLTKAVVATYNKDIGSLHRIVVVPIADVKDLTSIRGTGYEEQASVDFRVGFATITPSVQYAYADNLQIDSKMDNTEGVGIVSSELDITL